MPGRVSYLDSQGDTKQLLEPMEVQDVENVFVLEL